MIIIQATALRLGTGEMGLARVEPGRVVLVEKVTQCIRGVERGIAHILENGRRFEHMHGVQGSSKSLCTEDVDMPMCPCVPMVGGKNVPNIVDLLVGIILKNVDISWEEGENPHGMRSPNYSE